jgi:hypothetical protein
MSIHESDFVFIVRHGTCLFRHDLMGSPSSVYFLMDPAATVLLSPQYMEELIMKTMYTTAPMPFSLEGACASLRAGGMAYGRIHSVRH